MIVKEVYPVTKDVAMAPKSCQNRAYYCPSCFVTISQQLCSWCPVCGQLLDWSGISIESEEMYEEFDSPLV